MGNCEDLVDLEKEYCWPQQWVKENPFNGPLDIMLSQLQADKHHILKKQGEFLKQGLDGADKTLKNAMDLARPCDHAYAADYGLIDWVAGFDEYHKANLDFPRRGVQVHRIFIIPDTLLKRPKQLKRYVEVMFEQARREKFATQVWPNGKECPGELIIKVALQSELEKQAKEKQAKYKFRNGMVFFDYGNGIRWVLEETVNDQATNGPNEKQKQPSFLGRYYALRSYVFLSKIKTDGSSVEKTLDNDDVPPDIRERYDFLRWLTSEAATPIVCMLPRFSGDDSQHLLDALKEGKNPCKENNSDSPAP